MRRSDVTLIVTASARVAALVAAELLDQAVSILRRGQGKG